MCWYAGTFICFCSLSLFSYLGNNPLVCEELDTLLNFLCSSNNSSEDHRGLRIEGAECTSGEDGAMSALDLLLDKYCKGLAIFSLVA